MNRTLIIITAIVCISALIACYMYFQNTRHTVVGSPSFAYQIDKRTGESWTLIDGKRTKNIEER